MDRSLKKKQYERQRRDRISEAYREIRQLLVLLNFDSHKLNTNLHILHAVSRSLKRQLGRESGSSSSSESDNEGDLKSIALKGGQPLQLDDVSAPPAPVLKRRREGFDELESERAQKSRVDRGEIVSRDGLVASSPLYGLNMSADMPMSPLPPPYLVGSGGIHSSVTWVSTDRSPAPSPLDRSTTPGTATPSMADSTGPGDHPLILTDSQSKIFRPIARPVPTNGSGSQNQTLKTPSPTATVEILRPIIPSQQGYPTSIHPSHLQASYPSPNIPQFSNHQIMTPQFGPPLPPQGQGYRGMPPFPSLPQFGHGFPFPQQNLEQIQRYQHEMMSRQNQPITYGQPHHLVPTVNLKPDPSAPH